MELVGCGHSLGLRQTRYTRYRSGREQLKEPGASNENMPAWREVFLYLSNAGIHHMAGLSPR